MPVGQRCSDGNIPWAVFADLRPRLTLIQWRYEFGVGRVADCRRKRKKKGRLSATLSYGKERTAAADGAAAAAKALKTRLTLTYVKDPCANSACTADPVARRSHLTAPSLEEPFCVWACYRRVRTCTCVSGVLPQHILVPIACEHLVVGLTRKEADTMTLRGCKNRKSTRPERVLLLQ